MTRTSSFVACTNKFIAMFVLWVKYKAVNSLSKGAFQRYSWKKVFRKHVANLQEKTHAKWDFNKVAKQLY